MNKTSLCKKINIILYHGNSRHCTYTHIGKEEVNDDKINTILVYGKVK